MPSEKPSENPLEQSIDLRQDRRQWLKTSATMIGASLLPAAAVAGEPSQAETKPAPAATTPAAAHEATAAHFFTPAQHVLVEELTETIIPADSHSGGAKAAKVADTIDQYLRQTYDDDQRALWREGLRLIDLMSQHYNGKTFVNASSEERIAVLKVLSDNSKMDDVPEVKFFNALKEATVGCYYTSKIGIHDELEYKGNRILQEYVGCNDQDLAKS
jgi:Gluconate 2-dehydrogenase subunit 3